MKSEQNKIGLIIADENEIHKIDKFVFQKSFKDPFLVNQYKFDNKIFYVIHSKIGLVNAAIATQHLIDKYKVTKVWNYGAVGSTGKYKKFDVVIPTKFLYFDAKTPWYKLGQIPGENEFFENSLAPIGNDEVVIASGNSFISDVKQIEEINEQIQIHLIDMESCSIAQTCKANNVDFYCIKAISDVIGQDKKDKDNINYSIKKASLIALEEMIKLINEF